MLVERVCVVKTLTQAFHIVYYCGYLYIHACIQRVQEENMLACEDLLEILSIQSGNSLFDKQVRVSIIHTSHLSSC